jgi:hypothetical protein
MPVFGCQRAAPQGYSTKRKTLYALRAMPHALPFRLPHAVINISLSSVIRHLSSVLCPLSSDLCHPSSVICPLSSDLCPLSSVL